MKFNLGKDINSVLNTYPKLKYFYKGNNRCLLGEIDIFDTDNNYCDSFNVRIMIPKDYPMSFPKLYEIGNKIKTIDSSHINEDESCCVCSLQEEDIRKRKGITIFEYIKEFTIPFLANILYYRENGEYANGEYKHGIEGIIQYYQELLNKNQVDEILCEINTITTNKFKRNAECYCGSGLKLKKCHLNTVNELNKLSKERLSEDILIMKNKDTINKYADAISKSILSRKVCNF